MATALSVTGLEVSYGPLRAVRDLSFEIEEGQTVALLGANGAGKSSTIRAISGLVTPTGGEVMFEGRSLRGLRPEVRVRRGIATVPEGRELFQSLTVEENLLMGAYLRRDTVAVRRDLQWVLDLFPDLAERLQTRAGNLSGGQGQMVAIGRALMAAPRLLLLDEPSHGLAPLLVEAVFVAIRRLREERNLSLVLVEQNAGMALTAASYGYVLETGAVALHGPTWRLRTDPAVRALYLGG